MKNGEQRKSILAQSRGRGIRSRNVGRQGDMGEGSIHNSRGNPRLLKKKDLLDVLVWKASSWELMWRRRYK